MLIFKTKQPDTRPWLVCAVNANGEQDAIIYHVQSDQQDDYDNIAEELMNLASSEDYTEPMCVFDEHEQRNLKAVVLKLVADSLPPV